MVHFILGLILALVAYFSEDLGLTILLGLASAQWFVAGLITFTED